MHALAPLVVGPADDGRLAYRLVPVDDVFDLAAGDVGAATDDQVLLAVDDVDEALGIDCREIARMQPTIADCLRGALRIVPVARHHQRPTKDDLADLARLHFAAFLGHYAQLAAESGPAAGAQPLGIALQGLDMVLLGEDGGD